MDVAEIRRKNIEMMVRLSGGPTEFGRLVGREQAQVSQWISTTNPKPIGGRLARDIEASLDRSRGWLDAPQWEKVGEGSGDSSQAPALRRSEEVRPAADTLRSALIVTERVLERTKVAVPAEARAELVLAVYDLIQEGQAVQQAERMVSRMLRAISGVAVTD